MMKLYKSEFTISTYLIDQRGNTVLVEFGEADNTYMTNDPVIQKGIEQHAYYGSFIKRLELNGEEEQEPQTIVVSDSNTSAMRQVESVDSLIKAKDYLKRIGVSISKITTAARALEVANDLNVNFPNLKI